MATISKSRSKQTASEKIHPIFKARLGALQIALWGNEHKNEVGELVLFHNATIERSFRDHDEKWQKSTIQLRSRDFGDTIALLQSAQQFLAQVK